MNPLVIGLSLVTLGIGTAVAEMPSASDPTTTAAIDVQAARNAVAAPARSAVDQVFGQGQGDGQAAAGAPPSGDPAAAVAPPNVAVDVPVDGAGGEEVAAVPPDLGRDPFRPFTLDLRPDMPEGEIVTPLQRYELPQLRLAGVVLDLTTPRAMLQDNSGMGFIVTPGTPIGRRRGVVKAIESRRVIVEETILDYYGREQIHQVAIEMPKDDKPQSANQE